MKAYLVGGAVRDKLLGLPVGERDWVVVGATAEEMLARGFRPLDRRFPVFSDPQTGEEYALARREMKVATGHRGFQVYAGPEVTLEEDLKRRDLTINAMAEAKDGTIIDPFGGRNDLNNGLLRHVSPAFVEDPLRVLRTARFAARFARWGFRIAHRTHALMRRMVDADELAALSSERMWWETKRALGEDRPDRYFEVLHRCGALARLAPELDGAIGPAPSPHQSGESAYTSPLSILLTAGKLSSDPVVRYAALMGAIVSSGWQGGEATHKAVLRLMQRCRAESPFRELALLVCQRYCFFKEADSADAQALLAGLEALDAMRRRARFEQYLRACQALAVAEGRDPLARIDRLKRALCAVQSVDAKPLAEEGLEGQRLADELRRLRLKAISAVAV